jgi:uncharacterized membrane protein
VARINLKKYSFSLVGPCLICLFSATGLFISGSLSAAHWFGTSLPCGGSVGCEVVARSQFAYFHGVPIAIFGVAAFICLVLSMAVGASDVSKLRQAAWNFGYSISLIASLLSLALTCYSILVIKATCIWCVGSGLMFMSTYVVYAYYAYTSKTPIAVRFSRAICSISAVAILLPGIFLLWGAEHFSLQTPPYDAGRLSRIDDRELIPADSPRTGAAHADLTVVFFGDLECSACAQALPRIKGAVEATTNVQLVYRHFPQPYHVHALEAAIASEEARTSVGFWSFVANLDQNGVPFDLPHLRQSEKSAGLSQLKLSKALVDQRILSAALVHRDVLLGRALGLKVTPSIFLIKGKERHAVAFRIALAAIRAAGSR